MFIVHVVRQFTPSVGGLEDVVRELSARQVRAGHDVRVVTLDRVFLADPKDQASALPSRETVDGVEVIRIPFWGSHRYPIAPQVLRHIRNASIVHVHGIDFFFDFLALTKMLHRRRLVVSTHGGFFHTKYASWLKSVWFRTITRLSMRTYAAVVAVSSADFERFKAVRAAGLCCIENGANIDKFADAGSNVPVKAMICLGRLSTNKRLDRLVAWLAEVRRTDPEWSLTIAGRAWDEDERALSQTIKALGQQDAISVLISPTNDQLRQVIGRTSFCVSASEYEGFGLAAVEGLSAGLYPLLSNIPAFRALIDRTGLGTILAFNSPAAAAQALLATWKEISDSPAASRNACIDAARSYDWNAVSARYLAVYKDVRGEPARTILDVPIQLTNRAEAAQALRNILGERSRTCIAFGNANLLNLAHADPAVHAALQDFVILNDGIGTDIASRILYGSKFPDNLNGTDFVPYFLSQLEQGQKLFLIGSKPGVPDRAASALTRRFPQHRIVGVQHGFGDINAPGLIDKIRASKADILLVGLGNPTQELWLARHFKHTGCALGFAVGALFDFVAGEVPRAPFWVRSARLEWVYRLCLEPRRLASRYLIGNPRFLARIVAVWWSGARGGVSGTNLSRMA